MATKQLTADEVERHKSTKLASVIVSASLAGFMLYGVSSILSGERPQTEATKAVKVRKAELDAKWAERRAKVQYTIEKAHPYDICTAEVYRLFGTWYIDTPNGGAVTLSGTPKLEQLEKRLEFLYERGQVATRGETLTTLGVC